eukprot:scaffold241956_cov29-Tisochrysis_lutea.AAC.1
MARETPYATIHAMLARNPTPPSPTASMARLKRKGTCTIKSLASTSRPSEAMTRTRALHLPPSGQRYERMNPRPTLRCEGGRMAAEMVSGDLHAAFAARAAAVSRTSIGNEREASSGGEARPSLGSSCIRRAPCRAGRAAAVPREEAVAVAEEPVAPADVAAVAVNAAGMEAFPRDRE